MAQSARTNNLGILAPLGGIAFTAVWFILGFVSDGYTMWDITVASYSPIAQPISGLGLGSTAPIMNTAFVVCGALVSIGTWTAMRAWPHPDSRGVKWARRLVALCGVGMAMDGIFNLESIVLHTLGFFLGVGVAGVGFFVAGRTLRSTSHKGLSRFLQIAGPLNVVGMLIYFVTFNPENAGDNIGMAGLTERILLVLLMATASAIGLSSVGRRARQLS